MRMVSIQWERCSFKSYFKSVMLIYATHFQRHTFRCGKNNIKMALPIRELKKNLHSSVIIQLFCMFSSSSPSSMKEKAFEKIELLSLFFKWFFYMVDVYLCSWRFRKHCQFNDTVVNETFSSFFFFGKCACVYTCIRTDKTVDLFR